MLCYWLMRLKRHTGVADMYSRYNDADLLKELHGTSAVQEKMWSKACVGAACSLQTTSGACILRLWPLAMAPKRFLG